MARYSVREYIHKLQLADAQITNKHRQNLFRAGIALSNHASGIAHRKTGFMANTIAIREVQETPGSIRIGIGSLAPYTVYELARGGAHDWAQSTLSQRQDILEQLARECANDVAEAIT